MALYLNNVHQFNASIFYGILFMHVLALISFWFFTWQGLGSFLILLLITIPFGITMGFHRLLAHGSFKTSKPFRYFLTICGCLALQDGPIQWVATHRLHHKETEKANDPPSPTQGFLWSHLVWNFYKHPQLKNFVDFRIYAPELCRDQIMVFLSRHYVKLYMTAVILWFAIGTAFWGWKVGLSMILWGFAARTVYTWHTTWLVNSVCHIWGYQSFLIENTSRNNWWVAFLTFGEGWHNNHHAQPRSAKMGFVWYEIDITFWLITLLEKMGFVRKIVHPHFE